jgi:hypothetical protein
VSYCVADCFLALYVTLIITEVCAIRKVRYFVFTPWRHVVGVEVWLHSFWTSALCGDAWLTLFPTALIQGNNPELNWRLDQPQSRSGHFWKKRNFLALTGIRTHVQIPWPNIIGVKKSRWMSRAGAVACVGKKKKCMRDFGGATWRKETTWTSHRWEANVKMGLTEIG